MSFYTLTLGHTAGPHRSDSLMQSSLSVSPTRCVKLHYLFSASIIITFWFCLLWTSVIKSQNGFSTGVGHLIYWNHIKLMQSGLSHYLALSTNYFLSDTYPAYFGLLQLNLPPIPPQQCIPCPNHSMHEEVLCCITFGSFANHIHSMSSSSWPPCLWELFLPVHSEYIFCESTSFRSSHPLLVQGEQPQLLLSSQITKIPHLQNDPSKSLLHFLQSLHIFPLTVAHYHADPTQCFHSFSLLQAFVPCHAESWCLFNSLGFTISLPASESFSIDCEHQDWSCRNILARQEK